MKPLFAGSRIASSLHAKKTKTYTVDLVDVPGMSPKAVLAELEQDASVDARAIVEYKKTFRLVKLDKGEERMKKKELEIPSKYKKMLKTQTSWKVLWGLGVVEVEGEDYGEDGLVVVMEKREGNTLPDSAHRSVVVSVEGIKVGEGGELDTFDKLNLMTKKMKREKSSFSIEVVEGAEWREVKVKGEEVEKDRMRIDNCL